MSIGIDIADPDGEWPIGDDESVGLYTLLDKASVKAMVRPGEVLFLQGDPAVALYYVERGSVLLSAVSSDGKEGVIAFLGPGDIVGEGAIARMPHYLVTATALDNVEVLRIERNAMVDAIRRHPALAESLVRYLLTQNTRITTDLLDQLLLSCEKRLAHLLVGLAGLEQKGSEDEAVIHKISDELLAAKIGTTRSRVNHFMNRFRNLGLIDYHHDRLTVRRALVEVILEG